MDRTPDLTSDAGVVLANEFASVLVRVVQRRNGQVLELVSARSGSPVVLDATVLDLLSQTPMEAILALSQEHGHGDDTPEAPSLGSG